MMPHVMMVVLKRSVAGGCNNADVVTGSMLGFMQEYDALTTLKGVDHVIQVIAFDNGERVPPIPNVPQQLYMEYVHGKTLEEAMDRWKKVSSMQGSLKCYDCILGNGSSSGLGPHSRFIGA